MYQLWSSVLVTVVLSCLCHGAAGSMMEETIKDLYSGPDESEGRFFLNYDQAAAFNTSVAFTIPLFSFTLPGAGSTTTGLDKQSFGAMAFVALFLLGGLGVAIYTTTAATGRSMDEDEDQYMLPAAVTSAISALPNVVDTDMCAKLAVCGAYQDSAKYGYLSYVLQYIVPSGSEVPAVERSEYQIAAQYGLQEDADNCYYEYPCLVQPLDVMLYAFNFFSSE